MTHRERHRDRQTDKTHRERHRDRQTDKTQRKTQRQTRHTEKDTVTDKQTRHTEKDTETDKQTRDRTTERNKPGEISLKGRLDSGRASEAEGRIIRLSEQVIESIKSNE